MGADIEERTDRVEASRVPRQFSGAFDANDLRSSGLLSKLTARLLDDPQWLFGFLRRVWPVPKLGKWAMLTLYDDVQDALSQQHIFEVPFGPKMEELDGGPNFLLGMQDGPEYRRQRQFVMQTFRLEDVGGIIGPASARLSQEAVAKANGKLDAIADLVTLVPTELCESYYGIPIPDKRAFALWSIAMSTYTFADPTNNPAYRRAALAAAERTRALVDDAIAATKHRQPAADTILARMVKLQAGAGGGPSDPEIRAMLMGMVTGFVPTNTMAAGHMLEMLLRRRDFLRQAQAAAIGGDDRLLSRCLFEAMRFKPLNPGPFRRCSRDYIVAEGSRRAATIRAGTNVLVSTQSAMFDASRIARPYDFDPNRPASDYLLFGGGMHWCVGAFIADAQVTQMFKALLVKRRLRRAPGRAGQLSLIGPFPEHLHVEFDP